MLTLMNIINSYVTTKHTFHHYLINVITLNISISIHTFWAKAVQFTGEFSCYNVTLERLYLAKYS